MTLPDNIIALNREDGRVVYHNGLCGPLPKDMDFKTLSHAGPYTVGSFSVPNHWVWARWTDRTKCPVSIKRAPSQIVAANRMFAYGDAGLKVSAQGARVPYTLMGSSNITRYMPTTGERPDIGLITDNSARFMLGQDPLPMIDWALAAESCPMHYRDEKTDRPIDLFQYPQANHYADGGQGSPRLYPGPQDPDGYCRAGGGWTPQQAHYCEMSYLAHMATLDMGFLEDLQFSANFTTGICDAAKSTPAMTIMSGEPRGIAWGLRNLFMAHIATQDAEAAGTLPASCHPSGYWKKLLDNQLVVQVKAMSDPANQVFRLLGSGKRFGPWQVDYQLMALAFGVLTGHADWAPLYLWALKNAIDRTSGESGYPVGWGGAYYLNTCPWLKNADGSWNYDGYDTSKPFNWKQAFDWLQNDNSGTPPSADQLAKLAVDPFNGGVAMSGYEYLMNTRAVLVMAADLELRGFLNVRGTYPNLDKCIFNVTRMLKDTNPRASVVLSNGAGFPPPEPIPPVTPPPLPPAGEIHMSDPGNLAIGQTAHATLTFDDGHGGASQPPVNVRFEKSGGVSVAADATGVVVTGVSAGPFSVTAKADGCPDVTIAGSVALPLAARLHLAWD